jgi:hypothetical protein
MSGSLYDQFHTNVQGTGPLNEASTALTRQSIVYENLRDNLTQALSGIKATYTGNASDAMGDAFTSLSDSFNDGANFAGSASLACDTQAGSFATAQAKITNQVPVPAAPWYEPVDPFSTSHDDAIQQNSQIDSANEAAYNAYGSDTTGNLGYVQPTPASTAGFGAFSVTQQGNGTTIGSPAGFSGSSGSGSGGHGSSGAGSNTRYTAGGHSGYVPPSGTSPSSPPSSPGGSGGAVPPGQTSTSSYTPPPSIGTGSGPGGGAPIGVGNAPGGTGGGPFGGNGPGAVLGPVGGTGGGALGGGGLGGGSSSSVGRGGFGPTGSGESPAGGSGAGGSRSGVGSTAGVAEEAETEGGVGGAAGRSGASGMPGAMGGRGGRGGEDDEHKAAGYLTNEDNGNLIVGDFDPVAPRVIGE